MGMTDAQFKAYLLEQLDAWTRVKELAVENHDLPVQQEADRQIAKLNTALKF